ncbi:hypothetical protein FDP22_16630 [Paroceanicella profunda]|uniref:Uncharacterized protein n=1 Tax=Paroceanicella profunda TaxID=2579971 RepID=A0A5B8FXN3_9RHOB|nr:hypothetical protein [Paroceanicella profunda]QDL93265.1 hypothetical protein FDP22_16630 [Paroceanicella profunda]
MPHAIEDMRVRGILDQQQRAAGLAPADAWEGRQRPPTVDLSQPRVDSSPRPDDRMMILLEAQDRYARLARQAPDDARAVVEHVCCEGRYLPDGLARSRRQAGNMVEDLRQVFAVAADALWALASIPS